MPMSPSGEGTGLSIREGEFDPRHGRQFEDDHKTTTNNPQCNTNEE